MTKRFRVAYLPLDDRPCNTEFPEYLAKIGNIQLETAHTNKEFQSFLKKTNSAILPIERWVFGGLVESRSPEFNKTLVQNRLLQLKDLLKATSTPVGAFTVLMRQAPTAFNEKQEKSAALIKQASVTYDKTDTLSMNSHFPKKDWIRYRLTRIRNLNVNQACIRLVHQKLIQFLCIALDDFSAKGLHQEELKLLTQAVKDEKLTRRIPILPGTDEMGMLLLTRFLTKMHQRSPNIFPTYSHSNPDQFKLRYEGCSLSEIVAKQILLLGGKMARSREESDILFFIHTPQEQQLDVPKEPAKRVSSAWLNELISGMKKNKPCILADVRYANGADRLLLQTVATRAPLSCLFGFSAWNTAANALGIALATGITRWLSEQNGSFNNSARQNHRHFLALRFLEDWLYQAEIRPFLSRYPGLTASIKKQIQIRLNKLSRKYLHPHFKPFHIRKVQFPWNRLFEISLSFTLA